MLDTPAALAQQQGVDRRTLPAPEGLLPELKAAPCSPPKPRWKKTIATIWQEMLI